MIGVSLNEPHTSRTALRIFVCMFALACLCPNTINTFKFQFYFTKIELVEPVAIGLTRVPPYG